MRTACAKSSPTRITTPELSEHPCGTKVPRRTKGIRKALVRSAHGRTTDDRLPAPGRLLDAEIYVITHYMKKAEVGAIHSFLCVLFVIASHRSCISFSNRSFRCSGSNDASHIATNFCRCSITASSIFSADTLDIPHASA